MSQFAIINPYLSHNPNQANDGLSTDHCIEWPDWTPIIPLCKMECQNDDILVISNDATHKPKYGPTACSHSLAQNVDVDFNVHLSCFDSIGTTNYNKCRFRVDKTLNNGQNPSPFTPFCVNQITSGYYCIPLNDPHLGQMYTQVWSGYPVQGISEELPIKCDQGFIVIKNAEYNTYEPGTPIDQIKSGTATPKHQRNVLPTVKYQCDFQTECSIPIDKTILSYRLTFNPQQCDTTWTFGCSQSYDYDRSPSDSLMHALRVEHYCAKKEIKQTGTVQDSASCQNGNNYNLVTFQDEQYASISCPQNTQVSIKNVDYYYQGDLTDYRLANAGTDLELKNWIRDICLLQQTCSWRTQRCHAREAKKGYSIQYCCVPKQASGPTDWSYRNLQRQIDNMLPTSNYHQYVYPCPETR